MGRWFSAEMVLRDWSRHEDLQLPVRKSDKPRDIGKLPGAGYRHRDRKGGWRYPPKTQA